MCECGRTVCVRRGGEWGGTTCKRTGTSRTTNTGRMVAELSLQLTWLASQHAAASAGRSGNNPHLPPTTMIPIVRSRPHLESHPVYPVHVHLGLAPRESSLQVRVRGSGVRKSGSECVEGGAFLGHTRSRVRSLHCRGWLAAEWLDKYARTS